MSIGLDDLGLVHDRLAEAVSTRLSEVRGADDVRWLNERLARGEPLRIHCGGDDLETSGGELFSRDRFYRGGAAETRRAPVEGTMDERLYRETRAFGADHHGPGYSLPLPAGTYDVTLHRSKAFLDCPDKVTEIAVEGERRMVEECQRSFHLGVTAEKLTYTVTVSDGSLDIEIRHPGGIARIAAIEVQ